MRSTLLRREYSSEEAVSSLKPVQICKPAVCDFQVETWREASPFGVGSETAVGKDGVLPGRLTQHWWPLPHGISG